MIFRFVPGLAFFAAMGATAGAQASVPRAGDALSPSSLRRIVEAISHDSTAGRSTPSPELEKVAGFIANEFRAAGLRPAGDDRTWFQRYPVIETILDPDSTRIEVGEHAVWHFGADFFQGGGQGTAPFGSLRGPAVLVTGIVSRESANALDLSKKVVFYLPPPRTRRADAYSSVFAFGGRGAVATIVIGSLHDSTWNQLRTDIDEYRPANASAWPVWTAEKPAGHVSFIPILELWRQRFGPLIGPLAVDTSAIRAADGAPKVTDLKVDVALHFPRRVQRVSSVPNVIGMLPGADPALRHEYVVITAHYDGLGRDSNRPPGPGSILNGADDNASGTAGLIQLAKAFAGGPRPKRSLLFVAVSGEEVGLWGSDYFAGRPPVPVQSIVANMNFDMIGRSVADSVFIVGLRDSVIGPAARRALGSVEARRLVVLDEAAFARRYPNEPVDDRSDHANFRRRGVPSIYFFTGWHSDYHETTDDADRVNYETMSRITRAALDMGLALGEASLRSPAPGARR